MCITLLYTFLYGFLYDYDVKRPNLAFYGERKQALSELGPGT